MSTARPLPNADAQTADMTERKGQRTRRRILEAARTVFAEIGYERATIRGIAAAAGVDKSSIAQYFGSKQSLFREAVHWEIPIAALAGDGPAQTAQNYARAMLTAWAADANSPMAVLLRTSMTSDDAADLLRTHITGQAIDSMAGTIQASDALAGAILMGVASQRHILRMPDLADADIEDILRLVVPLLQSLIDPSAATG